jgi:uncharacterized protein YjiS (DUF1127 family)
MFWTNLLGYAAAASVLGTFCMSTMVSLRAVAICSNVLFAAYGGLDHIYPVMMLHVILLPINVVRLIQTVASGQGSPTVAAGSTTLASIRGAIQWRRLNSWIAEFKRRARERGELINLSERDRRDIRMSRVDMQAEALKPFWRA